MTTILMDIVRQVRETVEVALPMYLHSYTGDEGGSYRFTHTWYKISHDEEGLKLVIDTLCWYENSLGPGYAINRLVSNDKKLFNALYDGMLADKLHITTEKAYDDAMHKALLALVKDHGKKNDQMVADAVRSVARA
ncbi:hypothetical protein [Rhizobium phage RHph_N46]|nr:hypothetical protein [Rhizobium phage RHph_N46]